MLGAAKPLELGALTARAREEESPQTRWKFCVRSKQGSRGLVQPLCEISISFPFYLTLPCWRPHRLTHHLSEEQNQLVACRCCDPRKQSALKQSTEHFVWSTFWNTGTVMLELTAPIATHRPSEAWPSLVYFVFVAVGYSAGWFRMNMSKLSCYESAKRMVIYMHIANMWRLDLLCKRGIIMGAFSSL